MQYTLTQSSLPHNVQTSEIFLSLRKEIQFLSVKPNEHSKFFQEDLPMIATALACPTIRVDLEVCGNMDLHSLTTMDEEIMRKLNVSGISGDGIQWKVDKSELTLHLTLPAHTSRHLTTTGVVSFTEDNCRGPYLRNIQFKSLMIDNANWGAGDDPDGIIIPVRHIFLLLQTPQYPS